LYIFYIINNIIISYKAAPQVLQMSTSYVA